jgi:superfamily I DNA/RNA helicase
MSITNISGKLSNDQIIVNNLPVDKNFVVEGGPGSGKTMLALMRAQKILEIGEAKFGNTVPKILFIVFNRPLKIFLENDISRSNLESVEAKTYHEWLWHLYGDVANNRPPQHKPFQHKWEEVKQDLETWRSEKLIGYDHILVDESQDLPIELIEVLYSISENITVFIDEEQNISDEVSTAPAHVVNIICDSPRSRLFLTSNHRNYQEILELGGLFTSSVISGKAIKGEGRLPMLLLGSEDAFIQRVFEYRNDNPDQIIAVLVSDGEKRDSYYDDLSEKGVDTQKYLPRSANASNVSGFSLDTNGIKLLTVDVSKGLEFDAVFIASIDAPYWKNSKQKKNLAMVTITRAKERLFLHAVKEDKSCASIFLSIVLEHPELIEKDILKGDSKTSVYEKRDESTDFDSDIPF